MLQSITSFSLLLPSNNEMWEFHAGFILVSCCFFLRMFSWKVIYEIQEFPKCIFESKRQLRKRVIFKVIDVFWDGKPITDGKPIIGIEMSSKLCVSWDSLLAAIKRFFWEMTLRSNYEIQEFPKCIFESKRQLQKKGCFSR